MPASPRYFAVCLVLALVHLTAARAEKPHLSGKWQVDLEASDSLLPILTLLDRSWVERKLAANAAVTNVITQNDDLVLIEISAPFYHETEQLPLDGKWHDHEQKLTGEYRSRTAWQGEKLVTENRLTLRGGEPAVLVITRTLDPETDRLLQVTQLETRGRKLRARRVWRRQND